MSRARAATAAGAIAQTTGGYRLDLGPRTSTCGRCCRRGPAARRRAPLRGGAAAVGAGRARRRGDGGAAARRGRRAGELRLRPGPYERYREDLADRLGVDPAAGAPRPPPRAPCPRSPGPVRDPPLCVQPGRPGRRPEDAPLGRRAAPGRLDPGSGRPGQDSVGPADGCRGRPAGRPRRGAGRGADPADVVGEVGSVLGVRDSVTGRRVLTPAQRRDVRTRIAQHLDTGADPARRRQLRARRRGGGRPGRLPGGQRADAARADHDPRTARRSPPSRSSRSAGSGPRTAPGSSATAAEAARPGVPGDGSSDSIVDRLDGLPLAIELAAVKVRAMSVADIADGSRTGSPAAGRRPHGARPAPDPAGGHRLVLEPARGRRPRRAAQCRSSTTGSRLDAAVAMLGRMPRASLERLVTQSPLTVVDTRRACRYRMLETVPGVRPGRGWSRPARGRRAEPRTAPWAVSSRAGGRPALRPRPVRHDRPARAPRRTISGRAPAGRSPSPSPDRGRRSCSRLGADWSIRGDHPRRHPPPSTPLVGGARGVDPAAGAMSTPPALARDGAVSGLSSPVAQPEELLAPLDRAGPDPPAALRGVVTVVLAVGPGAGPAGHGTGRGPRPSGARDRAAVPQSRGGELR